MITKEEQEKQIQRWENRLDLPPDDHFLREFEGWMFISGDLISEKEFENLASSFLPKFDQIKKERDRKLATEEMANQVISDSYSVEHHESFQIAVDKINEEYKKALREHSLESGLVFIKIGDGKIKTKSLTKTQERSINYLSSAIEKIKSKSTNLRDQCIE